MKVLREAVGGILTKHGLKLLVDKISALILPGLKKNLIYSPTVSAGLTVGKLKQVFPEDEDLAIMHVLLVGNPQQILALRTRKASEGLRRDFRKLLAMNPLVNEQEIKQILVTI